MNFNRRFTIRAFSSAGAGAAGLGLILSLGSAGGATPHAPAQSAVRTPMRLMPPSRHPRVTPSCSGASGPEAFDSSSEFLTNKSSTATFGGSNLAAAGYTGAFEGSGNTICDYNSVIVGGYTNTIDSGSGNTPGGAAYSMIGAGQSDVVSDAWSFIGAGDGNTVSKYESFIGAGANNTVSNYESFVGAGNSNTVSSFDSFVGAGLGNGVPGTVSFIGAGHNNTVSGHLSFVGAGYGNQVSGAGSFIGAGGDATAAIPDNQISGTDSFIGAGDENNVAASEAFVGGGQSNTVTASGANTGRYGFIGGGFGNIVNGDYAAIAGGNGNVAAGFLATVPGGYRNDAAGAFSFAAGYTAVAAKTGSFAWSDYNPGAPHVVATVNNEFVARASGGYELFSNAGLTSGVKLAAGSGAWSNLSDRAMKTDVTALDDASILEKVAALPVSEWSYTSEHGVRHVGPMAQDFYAAFGVGADDRHITSIDEDGVALAAIKALRSENVALRAGMRSQHAELVALRSEMRGLEATFASTRTR